MTTTPDLLRDKPGTLSLIGIAVVTVHMINASLFYLDAPLSEKLAWSALAFVAGAAVLVQFPPA